MPLFPKVGLDEISNESFWLQLKDTIEGSNISKKTILLIEKKAFNKGKTSQVFKLRDTLRNQDMVCKIDLKIMEGDSSQANEAAKNRWIC